LESFLPDIVSRRKRKAEKDKREERDRLRAQKADDGAIRNYSSSPIETFSRHDFVALPSPPTSPAIQPTQTGSFSSNISLPSTPPTAGRTIWGTPVVPSSVDNSIDREEEHETPDRDSGWLQGWEEDLVDARAAIPTSGKKNKKKILLMQTGGRRGA